MEPDEALRDAIVHVGGHSLACHHRSEVSGEPEDAFLGQAGTSHLGQMYQRGFPASPEARHRGGRRAHYSADMVPGPDGHDQVLVAR